MKTLLLLSTLLLGSCSATVVFPYLEKQELGDVGYWRAQKYSTYVAADSGNFVVEGKPRLTLGDKVTYYRKYPTQTDHKPEVVVINGKQHKLR